MSRISATKQDDNSPLKQITDEQINQCMQFCAMYNILHAIHNFKIDLKNLDEKKKLKIKGSKTVETVKGSPMSNTKTKQVGKKASKFQKPKVSKKKQITHQQQESQVDNYNYQQQTFTTSRLYEQPLDSSRNKAAYGFDKEDKDTLKTQNDLSVLISNLVVNNEQGQFKKKGNEIQNGFHSFSYYMNQNTKEQNKGNNYNLESGYGIKPYDGKQKSLYQSPSVINDGNDTKYMYPNLSSAKKTVNATDNPYLINFNNNNNIYSYNNHLSSYNNNASKASFQTNPYSQASYEGISSNLSHFNNHPINRSSSSQYSDFASSPYTSQFDIKSNYTQYTNKNMQNTQISKNLFHQQSSPLVYPQNYQKHYDQKQYQNQTISSPLNYQNTFMKQTNPDPNGQNLRKKSQNFNTIQKNQISPTKLQTPRSTNRSLSPLRSSSSCRNFFKQQQARNLSPDDRSETSRSKSRRKQRPGGSKSFYQVSLSGRKVISRQKQQTIPQQHHYENYYQDQQRIQRNEEYQVPYFRQQQEQEQVRSYQKKKYPNRMTRQTEISAVSGWQQRSQPQKSIKSQQFINPKQQKKKQVKKNQNVAYRQNQKVNEDRQRKVVKNQKRKLTQSSSSQHSSQSQEEVELDNIEKEMEELSNSKRNIKIPIKIDMSKKKHKS